MPAMRSAIGASDAIQRGPELGSAGLQPFANPASCGRRGLFLRAAIDPPDQFAGGGLWAQTSGPS
jgi:hypothetical protein